MARGVPQRHLRIVAGPALESAAPERAEGATGNGTGEDLALAVAALVVGLVPWAGLAVRGRWGAIDLAVGTGMALAGVWALVSTRGVEDRAPAGTGREEP
jgi:hypothetical protein